MQGSVKDSLGNVVLIYNKHFNTTNQLACSPDGRYLATNTTRINLVQVWDIQTEALVSSHQCYRTRQGYVGALAWSPDGTCIASAGHGALVWKARTGESIARVGDALAEVHDMTLSPDGTAIASTSSDEIQVWDTRTGEKRGAYHKHGEENPSGHVASIAWSPTGTHIASVCSARGSERQSHLKGSIHVWQAEEQTFGELTRNWICHEDMVVDLCWSPDGHLLASASFDGTVQTWQATTGEHIQTYRGEGNTANAVAWSPDGKLLTAALWLKSDRGLVKNSPVIQVWNAASGETITIYREHTDAVQAIAWSPDSGRIATAGSDQSLRVWNALTGETLFVCRGYQDRIATVAWSPDGKYLAGGSWDKTVRIWDSATGQHLYTYQGHTGIVKKVLWLPDSKTIASASYGVHIWRAVL
jgi:WD40 repeat protein